MNEICEIIELLLTVNIYNKNEELSENDLLPDIRKHYWDPESATVKMPKYVTVEDIKSIKGIDSPDQYIKSSGPNSFVEFVDSFNTQLNITVLKVAADWFCKQDTLDTINKNPVLASYYEEQGLEGVNYAYAKSITISKESQRIWVDSVVNKKLQSDEKEELLSLVHIVAPEEVRTGLDTLVLSKVQHKKIDKISKATEHLDYLKDIKLFEIGKILFVGPPGTGKTTTAKAMSRHMNMTFVEVKLSMVANQYLGETAKNIDKIFGIAKSLSPSILFIDEFDFIAKTRASDEHSALKRAVNTLLKAIDDISLVDDGVLLIAATNHPKLLDSAAWRRFDDVMKFPLPDKDMRKDIFEIIIRDIDSEFDTEQLADLTDNYSGSDLRMVLREAVLDALCEDRKELTQDDMLKAIDSFNERIATRVDEYEAEL
ncbi:MAG: ATP-binding protein [Methanosarcinales archaeon]|nr:ATP-binding protein [Methanosarcinales archaeon]